MVLLNHLLIGTCRHRVCSEDIQMEWLWVLLGSAFGGCARYELSSRINSGLGASFPWGTLAVNLSGSLAIGAFLGWAGSSVSGMEVPAWHALITVGFLGGYTTVSSFALQTLQLARESRHMAALVNTLISLTGCLAAAALGFLLTQGIAA